MSTTTTHQPGKMHIVILGASRGVGYYALLDLLPSPKVDRITLLLRHPENMESDPAVRPHIDSGRVALVHGDATDAKVVTALFDTHVDAVIVTIGGVPRLTLTGVALTDPTVCTRVAQCLLNAMSKVKQRPLPRVIAVSSMGIGENFRQMPLFSRILYSIILPRPHADKAGYEYLLLRASSHFPTPQTDLPQVSILSEEDRDEAPADFLPEVIILRPALFTNGEARGKAKVRAGEDLSTSWISSRDVARFITEQCLPGEEEDVWVNRAPVIGY